MSKYTTQVRFICESKAGIVEPYTNVSYLEIIERARPKIFNFNYPIWNENKRKELETNILKHFYTNEIGSETFGLWQLRLDDWMNSHMPYYNPLFEALDKQDELQCKYTGGTVIHLYMTERLSNATACKNLIKKVLTNYRLPYISITPTYSTCPIHGYIPGNHEFCPKCDQIILEEYAKEIDFNE